MVEHDEKTKSFYLLEDGYKPIFDSCTNVQFSKSLIDKTWRVFPFLIVNNHFWRHFNFFQNIF